MSSVFDVRASYKPFQYPWAFEYYRKQQQAHWLPEEVAMKEDIDDFEHKLTDSERSVITQLLKFFVQADVHVADNYMDRLAQRFKLPEIRMMLTTFAAFEVLHAHAYSYLSDSLHLDKDPTFYSKFMDIKAMREKSEFMEEVHADSTSEIARCLAIFGGFIEGVQLFSSFAILNSFPRRNLLKGTGQIITWSIRDESLHCEAITKLFRTVIEENKRVWNDSMKKKLYSAAETVVELEDAFIDACFELGDIPGMKAKDVKRYVRFMANRRLGDLGLKSIFGKQTNPFPWLEMAISGIEHGNFFETRSTNYAKAVIRDDLVREPRVVERNLPIKAA